MGSGSTSTTPRLGSIGKTEHNIATMTEFESLVERVRAAGYKITPPRMAVLEVIYQDGGHLNPVEVLEHARAIHPRLGRATVYRTLELLTQLGIVRPIYLVDSGPIYIRADSSHHHLVCSQCGLIIDFDQCSAGEIADELSSKHNFTIQSHLLEFYGLCDQCVAVESPQTNPPADGA